MITEIAAKELLRKSNHSAIEKRRRERLSTTLDKLKAVTPVSKDQQRNCYINCF